MKREFGRFVALLMFLSFSARADISAVTESHQPYVRMENHLQGTFGEAVIDAAQLGLALSSVITGKSMLINAALDGLRGGVYAAPVNRIYGGWTAIQETAQLLNSASDKAVHQEVLVRVSKDSRQDRFVFTFRVRSDDDAFGHIKADVASGPGIQVRTGGQNTRDAWATVTLYPRQLNVGLYPIVFFAKETDCSICLSIAHTVFVNVYDPCPTLNSACTANVNSYYAAWDALRQASGRFAAITARGGQALARIKGRENVCYHAHGLTASGGGSSEEARRRAEERLTQCLDDVDALEAQLRGSCPDLAYAATQTQCNALRDRERILAPYYQAVDHAVGQIQARNCCQEQVNPTGGGGVFIPLPPVITRPPPPLN